MHPASRDRHQGHDPRQQEASSADGSLVFGEETAAWPDLADRYRMLIEHTPDAICVHQFGRIVYMNPAGLRYLEADGDPNRVIGHVITEFIHADSIAPMLSRIADLDCQGAVSEPSEATVITVTGAHIPAEAVSVRTTWSGESAFQVILRDLTEHKAAQEALLGQAALINHVSDAIVSVCRDGLVTSWNPAAEQVYGHSSTAVIGRDLSAAFGVACYPAAIIAAGGRIRDTHVKTDGSPLAVTVSAAQMGDGFVLVCADQTAIRRAEEHFTAVVESLDEGVVVLDHTGHITSANRAAKSILDVHAGLSTGGRTWTLPFRVFDTDEHPVDPDNHPVVSTRRTGLPSTAVIGIERRRDNRRFWLSLTATLLDPDDENSSVVAAFSDITSQHLEGKALVHAATHDHLTGLPNRTCVLERLDDELARPRSGPVTVLFIDLDNFKAINDSHGHAVGDAVLESVADRLTEALTTESIVGRIGGDEFVAVIPNGNGTEADEVRIELSVPMTVSDRTLRVAASIGQVIVSPRDTRSAQDILNDADLEMYQSKPPPKQLSAQRQR